MPSGLGWGMGLCLLKAMGCARAPSPTKPQQEDVFRVPIKPNGRHQKKPRYKVVPDIRWERCIGREVYRKESSIIKEVVPDIF